MRITGIVGLAVIANVAVMLGGEQSALAAPPANDARGTATAVSVPQKINGSTVEATIEDGEATSSCGVPGAKGSVWYSLVGAGNRVAITIEAAGDLDAVIEVFERDRSQNTPVDCSATNSSGVALIAFDASSAKEYLVRVSQRSNSVAGEFALDIASAKDPARAPGSHLHSRGVSDSVNWARNPSDAWSTRMRAGTSYRINLSVIDSEACVTALIYRPGDFGGSAVSGLSCNGGYVLFTPGRGQGGRYTILVRAETRTLGNQRYHLQAARAEFDDRSPGRYWGSGSARGRLSGGGIDVVDVYNWDLERTASVDIKVSSRAELSIQLLTPSGRQISSGERSLSRRLGPGTYYVVVRAGAGQSGSYKLSRHERTITRTRVTFNGDANATSSPGSSVSITATVSPSASGKIELTIDRFDAVSGWQFERVIKGTVSGGSFSRSFNPGGIGRWRVKATYLGTRSANPSSSNRAHLRVQR